MNLSAALDMDPGELLKPFAGMTDPAAVHAEFCWDRSYADIYGYLVALAGSKPRAVVRFIESRGIYQAAAVLGKQVWRTYPELRRLLPPARRKEIDTVWKIHHGLTDL